MPFENLMGNEKIKNLLTNAVQTNNVLHSYLFVGIQGVGKSLFAKEFAHMILCSSNQEKPCKTCKSCLEFQGESHPDFLQIEPEDGKTIKIEQIRYLQEKIAEKPVTSEKKVYIIQDCDKMTREAANGLLKTLEEPPSYAVLILITANESKLLVTIKSRCTKIAFQSLGEEEIKTYLKSQNNEQNMTSNMIRQCQGSIGRLIKIGEEQEIYEQVEKVVNNIKKEDITQLWKKAEVLYQAKEKIMDLLDYMNVIFFEKLREEQDMRYTKAVAIIEETKKRITANANYDMSIDNLLLKIWEQFA
ncbi:MAG: DNA polymerase III subunit delta' [Clostridia bacterium]|jgi:DNA polymerase-3 subunit delta'|nr:DNA polymerase III subunit delta' [Clostridia bacterium]MCI9413055.1 DNA polymerase III subunit delta' [Clostridia bacterium]